MQKYSFLYLVDSYIKEFKTKVINATDRIIELETTAFYATGGGQPHDTGKLLIEGEDEYKVLDVHNEDGKIFHLVDRDASNVKKNAKVTGIIDWGRRYKFMRMHTASHIIASVFNKKYDALITGNQIGLEKTRFDFSLEGFDREKIQECIDEANNLVQKNAKVKVYFLKRDEAIKIPNIVKLAGTLPPNLDTLRIVEIEGIDIQADGGTHVQNTEEVGRIELVKMENKGRANRRVYFKLDPD